MFILRRRMKYKLTNIKKLGCSCYVLIHGLFFFGFSLMGISELLNYGYWSLWSLFEYFMLFMVMSSTVIMFSVAVKLFSSSLKKKSKSDKENGDGLLTRLYHYLYYLFFTPD